MTLKHEPRLISISGSVHSGKTTISRMIAVALPNASYLDGDMISAFVRESYPEGATIDDILPEVHEKIIQFARASLRDGLDIIVDYPLTDVVRQEIIEALHDIDFEAHWFLLKPDMSKILKGSKTRPELNEWEIERIKYHYSSPLMTTKLAKIIDSTNQTPDETYKEVMEEL